jgi:hypothetical protein
MVLYVVGLLKCGAGMKYCLLIKLDPHCLVSDADHRSDLLNA